MPFLQTSYPFYQGLGLEGGIEDSIPHTIYTYANSAFAASQVNTIVMGTPASNTLYKLTVLSERQGVTQSVEFTSAATATAASIQSQMMAALQANTQLNSFFNFTTSGANITISSRFKGLESSFNTVTSGGGAGFTTNIATQPSDPITLQFGRIACIWKDGDGKDIVLPSSADDLKLIAGFILRTDAHAQMQPYYAAEGAFPYREINVMQNGRMYIRPLSDISFKDPIHIYVGGENAGKVRASADGTNTVPYDGKEIRIIGKIRAGEIGIAQINIP